MSDLNNVTYYSASAGSGKTYTLTHKLADLIKERKVEPEKVILTTFTKKSAAEFRERAKAVLFEKGMYDQALRLDNAQIGTVHSVAENFIKKYWYQLGMSPDLQVMDDDAKAFYITQSLANLAEKEESGFFYRFSEEFEIKNQFQSIDRDFWVEPLKELISFASNYCIEDFEASRKFSLDTAVKIFTGTQKLEIDAESLVKKLDDMDAVVPADRKAKKTHEMIATAKATLQDPKSKWNKKTLGDLLKGAVELQDRMGGCDEATAYVMAIPDYWQTSKVKEMVVRYVNTLFDLARRWLGVFAEYKLAKHLIDFNDMEKYMFELLQIDEVVEDIKASYDYLFVDEFQDSSPLQVAIFSKLSEMVKNCIWVGDYKQAIYGFRGADCELVRDVTNKIHKEKPLESSFRSLPNLVDFANAVFVPAFGREGEEEKYVKLTSARDGESEQGKLRCWLASGKKEDRTSIVASYIANELKDNIADAENIAVLARMGDDLDSLAGLLGKYNIPVDRESGAGVASNQCALLKALLALVVNQEDCAARATVAFLTAEGYDAGKLIDEKLVLDSDGKNNGEYLQEVPLLQKLTALLPKLTHQSVRAIVETLVVELQLVRETAGMDGNANNVFAAIVDAAGAYEERCLKMSVPATLYGFNAYLDSTGLQIAGDIHGVKLFTMHGSKGLEWKKVILLSLHEDEMNIQKIMKRRYLGVRVVKFDGFTVDTMSTKAVIRVLPSLFPGNTNVAPSVAEAISKDPELKKCTESQLSESLRLLYVAVTRARDELILVESSGRGLDDPYQRFSDIGCVNVKNVGVFVDEEAPSLSEDFAFEKKSTAVPVIRVPEKFVEFVARDIKPSSTYGSAVGEVKVVLDEADSGDFIPVAWNTFEADQMNEVGTCIHNIFAGLDSQADREGYVKNMVASQKMESRLPEAQAAIIKSWDRFVKFLAATYGTSVETFHELPFSHLTTQGQIVSGSMDFAWKTADGVVLVDFKNLHIGSYRNCLEPTAEHYLGKYKGQFDCYQAALEAHGDKVLDRLIYQPITGRVVRVG